MKEIIKKNSKLIGILLGVLQGLPQGLTIESDPFFSRFNQDQMTVVIAFGLFVPPIIALVNTVLKNLFGASVIIRKINEYVNIYFMLIVGSLTFGISGWATLQNKGINDGTIVICAFFISGGIGFLIAYFIDGQFGRRAENQELVR
jgi:hypothetical protein